MTDLAQSIDQTVRALDDLDRRLNEEWRSLHQLDFALSMLRGDHGDDLAEDQMALADNIERLAVGIMRISHRMEQTFRRIEATAEVCIRVRQKLSAQMMK